MTKEKWLEDLAKYKFRDLNDHPLENCLPFRLLVDAAVSAEARRNKTIEVIEELRASVRTLNNARHDGPVTHIIGAYNAAFVASEKADVFLKELLDDSRIVPVK